MTELPDAPWVTDSKADLPDAPWVQPTERPINAENLLGAASNVPVLGPMFHHQGAMAMAALAPLAGGDRTLLPQKSFKERYDAALKDMIQQPIAEFQQQHPVAATAASLPGTVAESLAIPGSGIVSGMAVGGGVSATDALMRGEDPVSSGLTGAAFGAAGPIVGRTVGSALAGKAASAVSPTVDELKASGRAGFQHPEVAAVEIRPQAVTNLGAQIQNDLVQKGFRPITTPKVFNIVDELNVPAGVQSVNLADIHSAQKALGQVAREVDAVGRPTADSAGAGRALKGVNDFLDNLKQPDLLAGDASKAVPMLRDANANWAAASRAQDLGVRLTRAERQAAKSGSGSNLQNAIKQKVSAVLDVPSRSVGYSAAEKAAAEAVVRGNFTENALRKFGKLGFNDGLSLLLHAGAAAPTGGLSLPVGLAATGARKLAEHMTATKAAHLEQLLRQRSPLYAQRAATMAAPSGAAPALLQAALRAQALRSASPLPFQQSTPLYFPTQ